MARITVEVNSASLEIFKNVKQAETDLKPGGRLSFSNWWVDCPVCGWPMKVYRKNGDESDGRYRGVCNRPHEPRSFSIKDHSNDTVVVCQYILKEEI